MKISKLFHWLYGFVMLLPIFAIGSACLISTFNMASKEEAEIIYKYETNDVNSTDDLVIGRAYHFNIINDSLDGYITMGNSMRLNLGFFNIDQFDFSNYSLTNNNMDSSYLSDNSLILNLQAGPNYTHFILISEYEYGDYLIDNEFDSLDYDNFTLVGDFIYYNYNNIETEYISRFISKCNNLPIESVETNNVSAQDIFYDSVEKVKNMPMFSWAYNSFLVTPFQYILALFGVPSNHVVVELLSYWLSISIIWLVFDVIMYVPLLVHRWLDKGVLE